MSDIKTLADQLRSKMGKPDQTATPPQKKKTVKPNETSAIVEQIRAYDISEHKNLVHARFDTQTAQLLNHLKTATGIENTRLICFCVKKLFMDYPELKTLIKAHLEKLDL